MPLIQYLSRINFDYGAIQMIPNELEAMGVTTPLLVTDPGVADSGILDKVLNAMGSVSVPIFADTPSHPTEEALERCLELYDQYNCDGLIAVGGGSPIDLAKATGLIKNHGGKFEDYGVQTGGSAKIKGIKPVLAIPTTAGTGAEIGRAIVLTLRSGRVLVAVSLKNIPEAVICDPDLTLTLPPHLTAATGIDALTHGLESFLSTWENPPAAAIALDCIGRITKNIVTATKDGTDRTARYEMMMGALEGGMVLQKSLGAIHALSNPLGEYGFHHGMINAVLLPHVLRFNQEVCADKFVQLREVIGLEAGADLADWATDMIQQLSLPTRLSELGYDKSNDNHVATAAEKDHLNSTNPRPANSDDYKALLEAAF